MATAQPPGQQRNAFGRDHGNYATVADMPNGTANVLPSATVPFALEAGDRCYLTQSATVGLEFVCMKAGTTGGGDAIWRSSTATPDGYLNVIDFGALGNDPGNATGHDDSAAVFACLVACVTQRLNCWIPPSPTGQAYRIAQEVDINLGSFRGYNFRIDGGGTILCDTGAGASVIVLRWFEQVSVDLNFRGKISLADPLAPVRVRFADCLNALYFIACVDAQWTGRVFWLGAQNAIIYNNDGGLRAHDFFMGGAAGAVANILSDNWSGHVVENGEINDIGFYTNSVGAGVTGGSAVGTNVNQAIPGAWCKANDVPPLGGAFSQQTPVHRNLFLDENASRLIWLNPTVRLHTALIESVQGSGCTVAPAQAEYDINNVDSFEMYRSSVRQLTGGGVQQRDAVKLTAVQYTLLDSCRFATVANDTNLIRADASCRTVELKNMVESEDYRTIATANGVAVIREPAPPVLTVGGGGMADGATITITPGAGGGLVECFALLHDGIATGQIVAATGAPVTYIVSAANGDLTGLLTFSAVGENGRSRQSNVLLGTYTFDASTTLAVPPGATTVRRIAIGGGAGGGSALVGGGGGGGGGSVGYPGFAEAVAAGAAIVVTIGAGGAVDADGVGTSITTAGLASVNGQQGFKGAPGTAAQGAGGAGGASGGGFGGAGGGGGGAILNGGGGGGGGGFTTNGGAGLSNGTAGAAGTSATLPNSGVGGTGANGAVAATPGAIPGGGGGGASTLAAGGAGAHGRVYLIFA